MMLKWKRYEVLIAFHLVYEKYISEGIIVFLMRLMQKVSGSTQVLAYD